MICSASCTHLCVLLGTVQPAPLRITLLLLLLLLRAAMASRNNFGLLKGTRHAQHIFIEALSVLHAMQMMPQHVADK